MLASSICPQISAEELTAVANRVQSETFRSVETYVLVAAADVAADARRVLAGGADRGASWCRS